MFFIMYGSSATKYFSRTDLLDLLMKARRYNTEVGITGILLYKEGNFIQVLEGEEQAVRTLFQKIEQDPRHLGVIVLLQGVEAERQFPDWSMGFRDLNDPEVIALPGYNEFLNTPLTSTEFRKDITRCQQLLLVFKRNMR